MRIAWILVAIGAIVGIFAYFKTHKKTGTVIMTAAILGGMVTAFDTQKTDLMNSMTKNAYESGIMYTALFELTGDEIFREIAKDEAWHYDYLVGHGYTAVGETLEYPLTLEGAINSAQDAIKGYEKALNYAIGDSALKADLERILVDEKDHLNKLIQYTLEEKEESGLLDKIDIREIGEGIFERISDIIQKIFVKIFNNPEIEGGGN